MQAPTSTDPGFPRQLMAAALAAAVVAGLAAAVQSGLGVAAESGVGAAPRYAPDGALLPPADYREWVYLSSGLDMSYSQDPAMEDHSMFDNVFVDPAAWAAFKRTGHWPDKTMFVMEGRGASTHGSINKQGKFQTEELMGLEFHVRDEARFKTTGGWGFFAGEATGPAALLPASAPCYACHQAHGAVETTFTQFYPTAKPIAVKAGSYRSAAE
jgi:hypothetical protein